MKKTLLALAVAAVATSASAATVYNNDGTSVDVGGYFDVVLGKFGDKERTDLRNNESRVAITAQQDLGEGFKATGYARLRFDDGDVFTSQQENSFTNPVTNKLWLSLEKDGLGRVSFGKQVTSADDVSLNDSAYFLGGNNNLLTSGSKVVSFRTANFQLAEGHTLGLGVDYVFGNATKNSTSDKLKNGYGASLFYAADFSGLTLNFNAGYSIKNLDNGSQTSNATGKQEKAWRAVSQLGFAGVKLGAEYGETRHQNNNTNTSKDRFVLVGAEYQILPESKLFAQWQRNSKKDNATKRSDLENVYLVGVDYEFHKNVVTYVQYARVHNKQGVVNAAPKKSNENAYGVGFRVYF